MTKLSGMDELMRVTAEMGLYFDDEPEESINNRLKRLDDARFQRGWYDATFDVNGVKQPPDETSDAYMRGYESADTPRAFDAAQWQSSRQQIHDLECELARHKRLLELERAKK